MVAESPLHPEGDLADDAEDEDEADQEEDEADDAKGDHLEDAVVVVGRTVAGQQSALKKQTKKRKNIVFVEQVELQEYSFKRIKYAEELCNF